MKRSKKIMTACSLAVGIGAGAILFTPSGIHASSNVVLASVDWVNSIVNPINSKLTTLQAQVSSLQSTTNAQQNTISTMQKRIDSQQTTISAMQKQIDSLKAGNIGSAPAASTAPVVSSAPSAQTAPAAPAAPAMPSVVYAAKSTVTIYASSSKSNSVLATVTKGAQLPVTAKFTSSSGLWYKVSFSSTRQGWVFSGDVSTAKPAVKTVVTLHNTNFREGAATNYRSMQVIPKGTTLTYLQSYKNSAGETWYLVQTSTGKKGWLVSADSEVK